MAPHRIAAVQDGDEVVNAAHEGVTAVRATRWSCTRRAIEGRRPRRIRTAPGAAPTSTRGAVGRRPGRRRAAPGCHRRRAARRRRRAAHRAPGCGGTGPGEAAARAAGRRSTTPLSTMPPSEAASRAATDSPTARRWSPSARPRGHATRPHRAARPPAQWRRAPASASRREPSPQSACTMSPPGVRASTWAATGPSHGPRSRAGTSHAAPSTGRSSASSLASSVATRADRKRKASTTWPIASASSVFSPSVARPARSLPRRSRSSRPGAPGTGLTLGLERVRQRGRTGLVRAVAVTQMRERGQEIPRVAPLGRQPRERLVQGLRGPSPVRVRRHDRLPGRGPHPRRDWHRRFGGIAAGTTIDATGAAPRGPETPLHGCATSDYLRKTEKGILQRDARAQADDPDSFSPSFSVAGTCVASGVLGVHQAAAVPPPLAVTLDVEHDAERRAVRRRRGLTGRVQRRRDVRVSRWATARVCCTGSTSPTDRCFPGGAAGRARPSARDRAATTPTRAAAIPPSASTAWRSPGAHPSTRRRRSTPPKAATCTSAAATPPRPSTVATTRTRPEAARCGTRSSRTRPPTRCPTAACRHRPRSGDDGSLVEGGSLGQMTYALLSGSGVPATGWPQFSADSVFSTAAVGDLYGTGSDTFVSGGASSSGFAYGKSYSDGGHVRIWNDHGGLVCSATHERGGGLLPRRRPHPGREGPTASQPARAASSRAPVTRTRSRCSTPSATRCGAPRWTGSPAGAPPWPTCRATGSWPWSRAPIRGGRARSGP